MDNGNKYIGSSFDGFLKEMGIFEEVKAMAEKRVAEWREEKTQKPNKKPKQFKISEK